MNIVRNLLRHLPEGRLPYRWKAAIGALCLAAALAGGLLLGDFMQGFPFITVFPAVMIASVFAGTRAGLGVLGIGGLLALYLWVPPQGAFPELGRAVLVLSVFWLLGGIIVLIAHLMHTFLRELRLARQRSELISREMRHRLKNQLSLVSALLKQASRDTDVASDLRRIIEPRLLALAAVHDAPLNTENAAADLHAMLEALLGPLGLERFNLGGPHCTISAASDLALILHELATNAMKHGALSIERGRVELTWKATEGAVCFVWKELDGPMVAELGLTSGFGSNLLKALRVQTSFEACGRVSSFSVEGELAP